MHRSKRFFYFVRPRCIAYFLVTGYLSTGLGRQAHALDIFWRLPSGGAFSSTASWTGGLVPSNTDIANFSVNTTPPPFLPPPFTVTFSANVTNQALVIHDDLVVLDLNTRTYATTTAAGVTVGTVAGRTGSLTVTDGTINVTTAGFPAPTINVGAVSNSSGGLLVTGGGRITGGANFNVGHLHSGGLTVQSGGTISLGTNTSTIIGNNAGVSGVATITGIGSALTTNGLTVGNSGTGTLDLSILGLLQVNANSVIGNNAGSTATANVTSSAQWLTTGNLTLGNSGQGTLNISAVGLVRNVNGSVGVGSSSSGTVTVADGNSLWDNTGSLIVGGSGAGTVLITNQGQVRNTTGTLGSAIGPGGTLSVSDAGSRWTNSGQVVIGDLGVGTLNINAGGLVQNTTAVVGNGASAGVRGNGTVNVDGGASQWINSLDLTVANSGIGALNITGGGDVSNINGIIGKSAGSEGEATVSGPNSQWTNSGFLRVADQGTGSLLINQGGVVVNTSATIGNQAGSLGTAVVEDSGSRWTNSAGLVVGGLGNGSLTIADGGNLENTAASIGFSPNTSGDVLVTGPGSLWSNSGNLSVGKAGAATLEIAAGGRVDNADGIVGTDATADGEVIVRDPGSLWNNAGMLTIGDTSDRATLTVTGGGEVRSVGGIIGTDIFTPEATLLVTVSDAMSQWNNSADLIVGNVGLGELRVLNGGLVENKNASLARQNFSFGRATVDGQGSRWINDGLLVIGQGSVGEMMISNGGTVQSLNSAVGGVVSDGIGRVTVKDASSQWSTLGTFQMIAASAAGNNSLNVLAGGTVNVGTDLRIISNSTVNLVGGTINIGGLFELSPTLNSFFNFTAGTVRFTGDAVFEDFRLTHILGPGHSIGVLRHLAVVGTPTFEGLLRLDGGTFSAGSLPVGAPVDLNFGTFNLTSDNFTIGTAGLFGDTLALSDRNVNITNTATIQSGARLQMQGGAFSAGVLINQGTIDFQDQSSQVSGGLLTNTGTIRGNGSILNNIQNNNVGQIQTTAGQRLQFGGVVTNAGTISLVGGQMQFSAAVTNSASTGLISARDAIVRFVGGLTNNGSLSVSFGNSDVFGDIANAASGRMVVSGGAQATFYEDVSNAGAINVTAAGAIKSTAIFFGTLSGNGVAGGGNVFIEGDLRPGFSLGTMSYGGDLSFGPLATALIEIGGATPGSQHDRLSIAGAATLDGVLDVSLINGFTPILGQQFTVLTAGSIVNNGFTLGGPAASSFSMIVNSTSLILQSIGLSGDFDYDGDVDGTDFLKWQRGESPNPLSNGDLTTWRANYGGSSLAPTSAAVPEPSTLLLLILATAGKLVIRRTDRQVSKLTRT